MGLDPVRPRMAVWLDSIEWKYYGTFTFGEKWKEAGPSPRSVQRHTQGWLSSLPHRPGYWFCVERGGLGRCHSHALIQVGRAEISAMALWRSWFTRYGRATVDDYDPTIGAGGYLSKYLTKESYGKMDDPGGLLWDCDRIKICA